VSGDELRSALGPGLDLGEERLRTARCEWFDTFDRRLQRAGLTLERASGQGRAPAQLLLRSASGQLLQAARLGLHEATGDGDGGALLLKALVPEGPLRARLAPVVQIRALLLLASTTSWVSAFRVVDASAKTVARIVVEHPAAPRESSPPRPWQLSVVPLRGYEDQADRVALRLSTLPGLQPSAVGRCPYPPERPGARFDPSSPDPGQLWHTPARVAITGLLAQLLEVAEVNLPGVVADLDTEFLHDLRVSLRRARTALKLLGDALPTEDVRVLTADLKWMGDLTTPTRDLDAHLLSLADGSAPDTVVERLQPFEDFLRARRRVAHSTLVRGLRSARWSRACRRWRGLAEDAAAPGGLDRAALETRPIGELVPTRIGLAYRRARRRGSKISDSSPASDLHTLRKRCKELRYLLEFFSSALDQRHFRNFLGQLKDLQDCLGEYHDAQVQGAALDAYAEQMPITGPKAAPPLMALGRTAHVLELRQQRARSQFAQVFKRFASTETSMQVTGLASLLRPLRPGGRPARP
jgi:CHAD domain-containing protein